MVPARAQQLIASGDFYEDRNVASRRHGHPDERHTQPENLVVLIVETEAFVLPYGIPALELYDELHPLEDRVDAMPNSSFTLITPSPGSSLWWRVRSGHVPMRIVSDRRRTSTVSSATSRWPRTIRSSAHSLFPMPLSPVTRIPRPSTSSSTA